MGWLCLGHNLPSSVRPFGNLIDPLKVKLCHLLHVLVRISGHVLTLSLCEGNPAKDCRVYHVGLHPVPGHPWLDKRGVHHSCMYLGVGISLIFSFISFEYSTAHLPTKMAAYRKWEDDDRLRMAIEAELAIS
jgi:hypothetical protein